MPANNVSASDANELPPEEQPQGISFLDLLRAIFAPESSSPTPIDSSDTIEAATEALPTEIESTPVQAMLAAAVANESATADFIPQATSEEAITARRIGLIFGPLGALLLGYIAQSNLSTNRRAGVGVAFYALAIALWLAALAFEFGSPENRWGWLRRTKDANAQPVAHRPRAVSLTDRLLAIHPARLYLAAAATSLSALTYVAAANNRLPFIGIVAWLGSIALWIMVLSERDDVPQLAIVSRVSTWLRRPVLNLRIERFVFLGLAVLLIAAFFRLLRLDALPGEMTSDHVEKLLDAFDVQNGIHRVFFPRNGGREALQMYLVAGFANIFGTGISFLSLKLVTALEGLLLIPIIIVLGRELIDRETGLLAALLVAVSWWHTSLSRMGLRIALTPLIIGLILINLVRGLRTGQRKYFIAVGLWMGVGVYSYQALRVAPLLVLSGVGLALLARGRDWQWRLQQLGNLLVAGIIAIAVSVPLARFWADHPNILWNRVINRVTSGEVDIVASPVTIFFDNIKNALFMFNWRGDVAWISAIPNAPLLDVLTGLLFVLGLSAWLLRIAVRRDSIEAIIPLGLLILMLPSALTIAFPIENPSATRASGMIPLVYLLAAWPLTLIWQRWRTIFKTSGHKYALALIGVIGLLITLSNYRSYFGRYEESYRASALNPSEVASTVSGFAESIGSLDNAYLQGYPFWHDYRAIGIEVNDITWNNAIFDVEHLTDLLAEDPKLNADDVAKLFVVHPDDEEARTVLTEAFPLGQFTLKMGSVPNHDFYIFVVPAQPSEIIEPAVDSPTE